MTRLILQKQIATGETSRNIHFCKVFRHYFSTLQNFQLNNLDYSNNMYNLIEFHTGVWTKVKTVGKFYTFLRNYVKHAEIQRAIRSGAGVLTVSNRN